MRAFWAIELPEMVRQELVALQTRLKERGARVRWTAPHAMHLTLRFLGGIGEDQAGALADELRERVALSAPLQLALAGVGCFPHARRPAVVWVGVRGDTTELARVQAAAETAARGMGLPAETRPFQPHVTVARVRDTQGAGALAKALKDEAAFAGAAFTAHRVTLFESTLLPSGARYRVVARAPLGAAPRTSYNGGCV